MDTPTKQRLVGAAVLVALAVIFLPMLVKGPAPDSGVSDVPLDMPRAPADGDIETRDLPLVAPRPGTSGALDAPASTGDRLPTVDTSTAAAPEMQPAAVAAGDYAVHFGSYATSADADTLVRQLRASQLPGFREQTTLNGRTAWRVRIGPYATRAEAEAARLRAAHVRDDVGARVVTLDAPSTTPATPSASQPAAAPATAAVRSEPLPPEPAKPATVTPAAPTPAAKPAQPVAAAPRPAPVAPAEAPKPVSQPAAAGTGFAVQVGAFGNADEAARLRDRLRAAGFTAFTESVSSDKGALTRVRVGPVLTRADAERLRGQVSAKAGVSGMVRPHP
jgi:cell division septation protein DedD